MRQKLEKKNGIAIVMILLMTAMLSIIANIAFSASVHLHRTNRHALERLQEYVDSAEFGNDP